MTSALAKFNNFVKEFLANTELLEQWETKETQARLRSIVRTIGPKRKKDPNAPKHPSSSYIFYFNSERGKVLKAHPDMSVTDVSKEVGKRWRALKESQKTKFKKIADEDKLRYQKEMENYTPPDPVDEPEKKGKRKKDPNAPKRPLAAYTFFFSETRPEVKKENPDMDPREIMREVARRWKAVSAKQRKKFQDLADSDKERYESEVGTTNDNTTTEKASAKGSSTKKASAKGSAKAKSSAKAPAKSSAKGNQTGFKLFVSENSDVVKEENPDSKAREINKILAKMWEELDDEEREDYESRC